jgi:hypothetical protein
MNNLVTKTVERKHRARLTFLCMMMVSIFGHAQSPSRVKIQADQFQDGDLIFHTSTSSQSEAIQLATRSPYSHCGIIWWKGDQCYVLEASKKVMATPVNDFINGGKDAKYVIKRLKQGNTALSSIDGRRKMENVFKKKFEGLPYDQYFGWSNDRIYCSELIWKMYKEAYNIELGMLQQLKDFDLDNKVVKDILKKRYGNRIPYQEKVISPVSIFNSDQLEMVAEK